jgi:hypothetical protein
VVTNPNCCYSRRGEKEGRGPNASEEKACDSPHPNTPSRADSGAVSDMDGCKKGRNFLFTMPYAKSCSSIIRKWGEDFNCFRGPVLHIGVILRNSLGQYLSM